MSEIVKLHDPRRDEAFTFGYRTLSDYVVLQVAHSEGMFGYSTAIAPLPEWRSVVEFVLTRSAPLGFFNLCPTQRRLTADISHRFTDVERFEYSLIAYYQPHIGNVRSVFEFLEQHGNYQSCTLGTCNSRFRIRPEYFAYSIIPNSESVDFSVLIHGTNDIATAVNFELDAGYVLILVRLDEAIDENLNMLIELAPLPAEARLEIQRNGPNKGDKSNFSEEHS